MRCVFTGEDVFYKGRRYHVQDVDFINLSAKIGIPDNNGFVWETMWVDFEDCSKEEIENDQY